MKVKHETKISTLDSDFKQNMLLSFYNWPKIEKSAVAAPQEPLDPQDCYIKIKKKNANNMNRSKRNSV